MKTFALSSVERGNVTSPAWTGLPKSFDSQAMLCSIVESVFNTVYAVEYEESSNLPPQNAGQSSEICDRMPAVCATQNFVNQANRDSCGNAAVAATLAKISPTRLISRLSALYWRGVLTTDGAQPARYQPRPYSFHLEQQAGDGWYQRGATFLWTVATRDAWNVEILSKDIDSKQVEQRSKISAVPNVGTGSQGGSGASYFSAAGFVAGSLSTTIGEGNNSTRTNVQVLQGACAALATAGDQQACRGMLDGLLPTELVSLKAWFESNAGDIFKALKTHDASAVPTYDGWSPNVRAKVESGAITSSLGAYYHPVRTSEIEDVCQQQQQQHDSHPVMLAVNDQIVGMKPDGLCVDGSGFCMANHWVVLETKSCDDTCTVWTWGNLRKVPCDKLAAATTTIVHGV